MSQVCQQLRYEYFPLWMSHVHVGISTKDIPRFLNTFCRAMYVSGTLRTLYPQHITGYIPGHDKGNNALASPSVDILPLLKERLKIPGFTGLFAAEPIADKEKAVGYQRVLDALLPNPTTADMSDFALLFNCDNRDWINLVRSEQLYKVLLYPYATFDRMNVKLVLHEQPAGIRLATVVKRSYLPDLRRFGLEEVYCMTKLAVGSKLRVKNKKTGIGS